MPLTAEGVEQISSTPKVLSRRKPFEISVSSVTLNFASKVAPVPFPHGSPPI